MEAGLVYGCLTPHPPVIIPEIGGGRAEQVRRTREAMQRVAAEIAGLAPDSVIVISPHAGIDPRMMSAEAADSYVGGFSAFGPGLPSLAAPGDPALSRSLGRACEELQVPFRSRGYGRADWPLDHGTAVPLYFLQEAGFRGRVLVVSFSYQGVALHKRFGAALALAARTSGRRIVLVASGDLSHRLMPGAPAGYSPRGQSFDDAIVAGLISGDGEALFSLDSDLIDDAGECGYRSIVIALAALEGSRPELLSYEGPFGVGYLVARLPVECDACECCDSDEELQQPSATLGDDEREVLRLARAAVEGHVREGKRIPPPPVTGGLLSLRAGVFVSLKIGGELRGCIGTCNATEPSVAREIIRNAVAAASRDPRFPPVTLTELAHLQYSVDILSSPEPVECWDQLDPQRYGVIVECGCRRGLLLPALEGVVLVEQQVGIACRKAGISTKEPYRLQRFTVKRIRAQP